MIILRERSHWLQRLSVATSLVLLSACGGSGTPGPVVVDPPMPPVDVTTALNLLTTITMTGANDPDALAFSADGSEIAIATTAGNLRLLTVNIYNVATGALSRSMNNSTLETTTLNAGTFSDVFWAQDNVITAVLNGSSRIYWASGSGDLIADDGAPDFSDPCAAPIGFLHLFDPVANIVIDNTGERSVDAPVCIFNQSNQTVTATTINNTPGRISSALFDSSGDTFWVNYLERENFAERESVGTLEYDKSTLMPTGESINEGEALAITDTYRLITENFDYFLYPGARELAIRDVSDNRDPMNKVAVGKVPTNSTQMRFIALDDVTIIGDLPNDFGGRTTFNNDGTTVAVPYLDRIELYDVTGRVQNSALAQ
jgi:hypothetical protein